jgi:hypothetical protein
MRSRASERCCWLRRSWGCWSSGVKRDRHDGDLSLLGAVAAELPVGARRVVLGVGLKHLFRRVERVQQGGKGLGVPT